MLIYLLSLSDESNASKIEYIYNNYHDVMLRFAKRRLKDAGLGGYQTDAEDAVQNAFVKIVKYIDSIDFDVPEKELKAYILTIVSNESSNIISDTKYIEELREDIAIDDNDFFDRLHIKERYDAVIKAIGSLDEKYSITLLYHYYNNMTVNEIAKFMGISPKTVYTRLARGRKILLDILEEQNDL